jgi:hypothetical protein
VAYEIPRIGRLQAIDLRQVWPSEPYSFTPWLAEPDNLQFLAESLDLPGLELVRTEHPVDSFSADIVARIVDSDHYVLIENQLERTDHLHLGQVLTYAPRFDARVVVWVAREFTDAHRAALDWLNRITGENYAFFGVELRAVRIGDSDPAPLFDIVVKPNEWAKIAQTAAEAQQGLSDYAASNLEFWAPFHDRLAAAAGPMRKATKPLKDSNYWAPLAENGRGYISAWRSQSRRPHVGVFPGLYNAGAAEAWERLQLRREELDQRFGEPLEWSANKQGSVFKISVPPFYSPTGQENWPAQHEWLVEKMKKMDEVFRQPVLEALTALAADDRSG